MDTKTKDNNQYQSKPFNIRPLCFWAFFVFITIIICRWSLTTSAWIILVYFLLLIATFVTLYLIRNKTKDEVLRFLGTSRLFAITTLVLCLVVTGTFFLTHHNYTSQQRPMPETGILTNPGTLTGTVDTRTLDHHWRGSLVLSNATFDGTKLSGRVRVFVAGDSEEFINQIASTNIISFQTRVTVAEATDYHINNRIKYRATLDTETLTVIGTSNTPRAIIARYSKRVLGYVLTGSAYELMYSMLFGDRSELDRDTANAFGLSGLAHVLAVSGMHVGLIVALLMGLMRLLRLSRRQQLPVILFVLLLYCYLCGWRFSIMRACIMFAVLSIRRAYLNSTDLLSSICLAAIIIMIVFPFSLMSPSFQLSFGCMLGIAMFLRPINNMLTQRARLPEFIARGASMYLCTLLVCAPLMIETFGRISIVGIFANVLLLPLLILGFQLSVVAVTTYIGMPLLYIVNLIVNFAVSASVFMANLQLSAINLNSSGSWFLFYFLGLIFTTRFIFLKRRYKYPIATICIGVYLTALLIAQLQ
jgi:ComEC/Rec2-related protein